MSLFSLQHTFAMVAIASCALVARPAHAQGEEGTSAPRFWIDLAGGAGQTFGKSPVYTTTASYIGAGALSVRVSQSTALQLGANYVREFNYHPLCTASSGGSYVCPTSPIRFQGAAADIVFGEPNDTTPPRQTASIGLGAYRVSEPSVTTAIGINLGGENVLVSAGHAALVLGLHAVLMPAVKGSTVGAIHLSLGFRGW